MRDPGRRLRKFLRFSRFLALTQPSGAAGPCNEATGADYACDGRYDVSVGRKYLRRETDSATACGMVESISRYNDITGLEALPRRWVVERTLAWLGRYRRLSKDYEPSPESSESMILIARIDLMSPIPLRAWLRLRLRQGFGPLRQDRKRRRLVNSSWHRIRGQATVDVLSKALGRRRLPRLPTVTQPPVELMGWAIGPSICVSARLYLPAGSGRPLRPPLHRI